MFSSFKYVLKWSEHCVARQVAISMSAYAHLEQICCLQAVLKGHGVLGLSSHELHTMLHQLIFALTAGLAHLFCRLDHRMSQSNNCPCVRLCFLDSL